MATESATAGASGNQSPVSTINADMLEAARRNGWKITTIISGDPPAGQTDLFVYQPNPGPGAPALDNLGGWLEAVKYWQDNYFVLPSRFQPISGVSGLVIAARRACEGGLKLRQLRIMGHGNIDFATIGMEQVWLEKLVDAHNVLTPLGTELQKLSAYLDPTFSLVILDHCLCGQAQSLLSFMSKLWGGTPVRGYRGFQYWEAGDTQIGSGVFTQCAGDVCHFGVEVVKRERE